jgi:hypothetical protein
MQRHIVLKFVIHIIAVADCLFVCLIVTHQYWHIMAKVKHPASAPMPASHRNSPGSSWLQSVYRRIQAVVCYTLRNMLSNRDRDDPERRSLAGLAVRNSAPNIRRISDCYQCIHDCLSMIDGCA